jgi:hypothetical protein
MKYQNSCLVGNQEPTIRLAPAYKHTDGTDATKLLAIGGITLDEWQRNLLDDWMAVDGNLWVCQTCGLSVPRQNGKTLLIQGRCAGGMMLYGERVVYTAHLQKTSTETFEEIASFFDSKNLRKYVQDIKTALGREQIILKNGGKMKFVARTRNGGRGLHGDLLIFDEAQELDESQQGGFLPAISASLRPQTIYTGTPPEPESPGTVFRDLRQKAIDGKTTTAAWAEYSVKEIGNVADRKRWAQSNPAFGVRILETTIAGECEQMAEDTFARERLGWWPKVIKHEERLPLAIDKDLWEKAKSDDLKPEGKTAYGIKFSADGTEVCLCGAVIPDNGKARISLIERKPTGLGTQWLAEWLNERYKKASCVVIDGRNGVDVLIDKISDTWRMKGSVIRPTAKDMIASVSTLMDCLQEETVTWYAKQEALSESALSSTKRAIAGGWGFGGENSTPIEACALALWGAKNSKRNPNRKMRIG